METKQPRERIVAAIGTLPEARVVEFGNHAGLEVRNKRFAWYLDDHHGDGRLALHCRCDRGEAAELVRRDPARFHVPKYVGHHGWVGYWLDRPRPRWREVQALLVDAYRRTAPKSLVAKLLG